MLASSDRISSETFEHLVGECPSATVQIGTVDVNCVLDTGAETSLLSFSFFQEHLRGIVNDIETSGTFIRVYGANDWKFLLLGY